MAAKHLLISDALVARHLAYPELVAALKRVFVAFAARSDDNTVQQPQRNLIRTADRSSAFFVMPAYSALDGAFVTKVISFFPGNEGSAVPSHQGTVLLLDASNGCLLATIEAEELTARRTAAASAVASSLLAPRGSKCLAILGAGTQARSHIEAHLALFPSLRRVHVWSRSGKSAEKLKEKMQKENPTSAFLVFDSAAEAVAEADIVCTVTSSPHPVLDGAWLKAGSHVNAVGACRPDWRELEVNVLQEAFIVADSRAGATSESGDIRAVGCRVDAELGDVVAGRGPAVDRDSTRTVFKSLGMALEDLAAAKVVFDAVKAESCQK